MDCPPVLFLIFNRPDVTLKVFEKIREARPTQLFIAADGPRSNVPTDAELCNRTRDVVNLVDWECEVQTLFGEQNLGCKNAVISAIAWFFEHVDYGVILEDDCLPTIDFFRFCGELLVRYKDDTRIGMISGNNFGFGIYDDTLSYSFSRHGYIWGWATWKRCWEKFYTDLSVLDSKNANLIKSNISNNKYFTTKWWDGAESVLNRNLDAWSLQWGVTRYANSYLTIRPKVNLVINIGFGEDATHTTGKPKKEHIITGSIEFPLIHPNMIVPDQIADKALEAFLFPPPSKHPSLVSRIKNRFKEVITRFLC